MAGTRRRAGTRSSGGATGGITSSCGWPPRGFCARARAAAGRRRRYARDGRVLRASHTPPPRHRHACRPRPLRALPWPVGAVRTDLERGRTAVLATPHPPCCRRAHRQTQAPQGGHHVRRLALRDRGPAETLGCPAIQKRSGRSTDRVIPTRGPRAMVKSRGWSGGRTTSAPRARSAPLSRSDSPSARVRLPGPLARRGALADTPRRRAMVAMPASGSSARMRTQPGRPAGLVIAFRQ
jgi:hypothetical protein